MRNAVRLEQLLDNIHDAVVAGDLGQVAELGAEVDSLLRGLPDLHDQVLADRLRQKAVRNAACLQAAARGVRAARRRMSEIRAAQAGLATYDGQGKRLDHVQIGGKLAQRY